MWMWPGNGMAFGLVVTIDRGLDVVGDDQEFKMKRNAHFRI